jgi:hypothetical protein
MQDHEDGQSESDMQSVSEGNFKRSRPVFCQGASNSPGLYVLVQTYELLLDQALPPELRPVQETK